MMISKSYLNIQRYILIGIRENKNLFIVIRIISKPFDGGIFIKRFSEREKESERRT